ncbi:MAG TPA: hypothetical protein VHP80_11825 [Candidatus Acidoferrum sp.]|jgi:hypothetical protein|nr:hypothetical protein [Candidatus Acidoferrum sp.]
MKNFYNVTLLCFALGVAGLLFRAPWTMTPAGSAYTHVVLGYAPVASEKFANVPGARVDWGAVTLMAGGVGFLSIVIGASAYFFRAKRGPEKDLDDV